MGDYYIWVKALHIITVIAWMAGLLYLPRLFVYHANAQNFENYGTPIVLRYNDAFNVVIVAFRRFLVRHSRINRL